MKHSNIIFFQDENANEVLTILNEKGEQAAFDFLKQWDYGESPIEENNDKDWMPWGNSDRLYKVGKYVMSYNIPLNYIGLTEIIT